MTAPTRSARILAFLAVFAVVAAACSSASEGPVAAPTPVSEPAGPAVPSTEFVSFDGQSLTLASFAGEPLVVNFWASWCPSCVAEMSAAFKPVQEQLGEQITFVGMNLQDERTLASDLLDVTGVDWFNAEDSNGELYVALGGLGMPFTVFVNPSGEIVEAHNGPLTEDQLRDLIAELLLA